MHFVLITDAAGNTLVDSVILLGPEPLMISIDSIVGTCAGGFSNGSVAISVIGGCETYNYHWSNGATSQNLLNATAGTFTVTVTDANACTSSQSASIVVFPSFSPSFSSQGNLLVSDQTWSSYQWMLNGLPISGANSATYLASSAGFYGLTALDSNGCAGVGPTQFLTFVGVDNQLADAANFFVYPNPTSGNLEIKFEAPATGLVKIVFFDALGKEIRAESIRKTATQFETSLDLSNLASGPYFLRVMMGNVALTRKVIKE
ncbi:MAG: T9SS type A sorting domain-containing protein [Bacteroidetes bacterium]|nr:T9SS type A sorting domain-containing protein [Bacteroidota bacterium]